MLFLNPIFLSGLALASVPIIIHLLNRRRFTLVEWAPMKYLKLTIKTNRRRIRIEQFILLALRTLAILVLILAVARPVLSKTGFSRFLTSHSRTSRLIVIDDSMSMGYRVDRRSAMDGAKAAAADIVRGIGSQDAVTLIVTSNPNEPLVREAHLDEPTKLLDQISRIEASDTRSDWAQTLKSVEASLASAQYPLRDVTIITDLRKEGWTADVTEIAGRIAHQNTTARILDVGSRQTANVALLDLVQDSPLALPENPINLHAIVRNDTTASITGMQAQFSVGDELRPVMLPELPSGKAIEVPLQITPDKAGQLPLKFSLSDDALSADNIRRLNVSVRPKIDVTLVDGEPSAQPFLGAADFLALNYSIGNEPWHPVRLTDAEWAAAPPPAGDVLCLCDVAAIPPGGIDALERQVRAGMGLMIFCGDQIDPAVYNQHLYRDGTGLLPARLGQVIDAPVTGLVVEKLDNSPLEPLTRVVPAALARTKIRKLMSVDLPAGQADAVRVLARWNDSEGHPAVIEKHIGRGRVLLWTITANKGWSDWPTEPTFVLAVRSAAIALSRGEPKQTTVTAGEPIAVTLEEGQHAIEPKVAAPGHESPDAMIVDTADSPTMHYASTAMAGQYVLHWKDAQGVEQSHLVAANPDKAESNLAPIDDNELSDLLSPLKPEITHYGVTADSSARGREIWRTLATTLLALFVAESIFAVWVGRER